MDGPIEALFGDWNYCCDEIMRIREVWGREGQPWQPIFNTLGLMLMHCPEEHTEIVRAQIIEAQRRQDLGKRYPFMCRDSEGVKR